MQEKDPILRERELDGYRSIAQKIRNRLQQLENANDKDDSGFVQSTFSDFFFLKNLKRRFILL